MELTRRAFLQSTLGVLAAAALPAWFPEEAVAAESARVAAVPNTLALLRNAIRMGTLATGDAFVSRMGYPLFPQMLSDQEQLICKPLGKGHQPFEHILYVRDLATQEMLRLDEVTAYYCRSFDPERHPPHIYASPDSGYLLWATHSGTYIASRDGQTYLHWPGGLRHCYWRNDSRHWCAWEEGYEAGDSFVEGLRVYTLGAQSKGRRLPLAPGSGLRLSYRRIGKTFVITPTHMLMTNWDSAQWKQRPEPLQIMHLGYEPGTSVVYEPALPEGQSVTAMAFSPQAVAIAWVLVEKDLRENTSENTLPENTECEYTLAISDAQGQAMRTLGTLSSTRYPTGYEDPAFYFQCLGNSWLASTHCPHHLQWIPGQPRLSFTYDHSLWLVATEEVEGMVTRNDTVFRGNQHHIIRYSG